MGHTFLGCVVRGAVGSLQLRVRAAGGAGRGGGGGSNSLAMGGRRQPSATAAQRSACTVCPAGSRTPPNALRFLAGTFLYVAFMEVIPKELREPAHVPLKLAALLVGFCLMSVLAIWA